jgi:hypothetical protein
MFSLVAGILVAAASSTFYSLGVAFQSMDAKLIHDDHHLRISLLRQLATRSRWLLGTALSILGWPLQVIALLLAPLIVVQPALAAGLLVLLWVGQRWLGEHATRREHLSMVAIVVGVAGIALCAPSRSTHHATDLVVSACLLVLAVASLAPYVLNALGRKLPSVTMLGAGLGFAWSGVATKLASDALAGGHLAVAAGWGLSTAGASAVAALSEMSALQDRPAIQVAPVVFVVQTLVPVLLAPIMLGEHLAGTPLYGVPLVASLMLLVGGAAQLARSPVLLAITASGHEDGSVGAVPVPAPGATLASTHAELTASASHGG